MTIRRTVEVRQSPLAQLLDVEKGSPREARAADQVQHRVPRLAHGMSWAARGQIRVRSWNIANQTHEIPVRVGSEVCEIRQPGTMGSFRVVLFGV